METGTYALLGRGSDLGIEVAGPDAAGCLAAAVAAFAAAVTGQDPPPGTDGPGVAWQALELADASPEALLVTLLDELVVHLDADGRLGLALAGAAVDGAGGAVRLRARLALVALAALPREGVTPKAATWHGLRLGPDLGGGWSGAVMLDL